MDFRRSDGGRQVATSAEVIAGATGYEEPNRTHLPLLRADARPWPPSLWAFGTVSVRWVGGRQAFLKHAPASCTGGTIGSRGTGDVGGWDRSRIGRWNLEILFLPRGEAGPTTEQA